MQDAGYRRIPVRAPKGVVHWAFVDDEDYERLSAHNWFLRKGYAVRNAGGRTHHHQLRMHREVLGLDRGNPLEPDHINGVRLDNRRSNLRVVTHARNMCNLLPRGGASRYRGVTWVPNDRLWRARANLKGKAYSLGVYRREADAAEAVNAFWLEHGYEAPNGLAA
jgi:hypothetical protein